MSEISPIIQFKNITKQYKLYKSDKERFRAIFSKAVKAKTKKAVDDVSFDIFRGESVAMFGRNGAGKSTILKMITGVCHATSGEINITPAASPPWPTWSPSRKTASAKKTTDRKSVV